MGKNQLALILDSLHNRSTSRFEPGPELLDAVSPLVPDIEGGVLVNVLNTVDDLADRGS